MQGRNEELNQPMTFEILRQRLKHIAVLCWGLSIDLANEIQLREETVIERDNLRREVKRLAGEIYQLKHNLKRRKGVKND